MNVLVWHVHGSWLTALVHGPHTYLVPRLPGRGPDGRGRPQRPGTFDWPARAVEVTPDELAALPVDVAVLQRPHEEDLLADWLGGRRPPVVYVEHNTPHGDVAGMRHPMADRDGVLVVHVTGFNQVFWDTGGTPTRLIEHGIPDPGHRFFPQVPAAGVCINEPVRRGRVTGTDLLARFARTVPVRLFGMGSEPLGGQDLPQQELHRELSRCGAYLHTTRWTSLGLSLLEAMALGMPVVALGTTEAYEAVPADAGVVSTDLDVLEDALRFLVADPAAAVEMGRRARVAALGRYGLRRFLDDWDGVLAEVAGLGSAA